MPLSMFMILLLSAGAAWGQEKVAMVKMLRGKAAMVPVGGKSTPLAQDMEVPSGATVMTEDKSFVRLTFFSDKSTINVGPNSEMKIEHYGGGDAGVIGLVKGKIRSQVTKDYLQQQQAGTKSKVFVKTPNAVMGIRGTDFLISASESGSTSAVLFEGDVRFSKLDEKVSFRNIPTHELEKIADNGQTIHPGEFSQVLPELPSPTIPSVLNVKQLETMEKNNDFNADRSSGNLPAEVSKSIVPPGLTGATVANTPVALKAELSQAGAGTPSSTVAPSKVDMVAAAGFAVGNQIKPANGSFLHVDSGVVIAPPKDSVYDASSNSFIPSAGSGSVNTDGSYQPPKNVTITDSGRILVNTSAGQTVEVKAPPAIMGTSATLGDVMKAVTIAPPSTGALKTAAPGGVVDAGKLIASTLPRSPSSTSNLLPPPPAPLPGSNLPPPQAPSLSNSGGAIPGSPVTVQENSSTVHFHATSGD